MDRILFQGWYGLGRVVVVGVAPYAALVLMVRVRGKRSLAKVNASTCSSPSHWPRPWRPPAVQDRRAGRGVAAFALLLLLQYADAWSALRSERLQRLTSAAPTLLHHEGFLAGPMRTARVSIEDLRQVVRSNGHARLSDITAIVLDSDGTFSVLTADPRPLAD